MGGSTLEYPLGCHIPAEYISISNFLSARFQRVGLVIDGTSSDSAPVCQVCHRVLSWGPYYS